MIRDRYDMVVIGGGIHGVGVAQAAAASGHTVLVLEKSHLAAENYSRSSKLIHGGLRYMETGAFGLVRACLQERALLLRLAPELVHLTPVILPIRRNGHRPPWMIRLGLSLYRLLGGQQEAGFEVVPPQAWSQLDGLDTHGLRAVFRYREAQTDDAALTRAVMDSARSLGAELAAPATFRQATRLADGYRVEMKQHQERRTLHASTLVNASGPWVNLVLQQITPMRSLSWVRGSHLLLDQPAPSAIYYLEVPQSRRAVFMMPWQGKTLLGTTERLHHGAPEQVAPSPGEIRELMETVRSHFPERSFPISASFAGLRVLPGGTKKTFQRSRATGFEQDHPHSPRLISIYGGKLTAYRLTALQVLKRLQAILPRRSVVADTATLPLSRHPAPNGTSGRQTVSP